MILVLLLWILPFSLGDPYSFEWNSGNFKYTCSGLGTGWIPAGESCFYPYTLGRFNYSAAGTFCRNPDLHFSVAAVVDNWLVASSLRYQAAPNIYWTGVSTFNETSVLMNPLQFLESTYNPLWAADQPPISSNKSRCVALDLSSPETVGWRLVDCSRSLNVLCETFACLPDTFRCKDNSRCIPMNATHDHVYDCQDNSDEDPIVSSWASAQTDCRHVLLRGSGEFSSPNFPGDYPSDTTCRFNVEAFQDHVIAFTIEGSYSSLTVTGDEGPVFLPPGGFFSVTTNSRFLTFSLASSHEQQGFRVRFYSTDSSPCALQNGVATYDSFSTPFDCTFSVASSSPTQFLLFMVESMQKSSSAVVNVTGAGYSFGFSGSKHSQAVVIPSGEASLLVQDAWRTSSFTSFRIRVIPFGSTCLVIPLTFGGLSLYWPSQPASSFIPHCISFAMIGSRGHTWRVDNVQSSRLDRVDLATRRDVLSVTSSCTYRGQESITLGIKQLSTDFTISFKVSTDCEWPTGSYAWGSEVACVDGSSAESSICQLGGFWSVEPSVCLAANDEVLPDVCVLPTMQYAYPVSAEYKVGGVLSFRCMPTFFAYDDTVCEGGVCHSSCQSDGSWSGHTDCSARNFCDPPQDHLGASPIYDSPYKYGKIINYTTPFGMLQATAYSVCMEGNSPYAPVWQYYGFKFTAPICFAYPIDFGSFDKLNYSSGETATISCVSGYNAIGLTTCLNGVWSNTEVNCILELPFPDPCEPHGVARSNSSVWLCFCVRGYEPAGNPNQQNCQKWDPCSDGTDLCDEGATCLNTSNEQEKSYTCLCPTGTLLYTGPTNYSRGLVHNVTCLKNCKIDDILALLQDHYVYAYQDRMIDSTFSLYCRKDNIRGLGYRTAFIEYPPESCDSLLDRINSGYFINICNTTCATRGNGTYPMMTAPEYAEIFDRVNAFCSNSSQTLIGSNGLVCSPTGNFFNYPKSPVCTFNSCSALDVYVPGISNQSFAVNMTVVTSCSPPVITCMLLPGATYPKWSSDNVSCQSPQPASSPWVSTTFLGSAPTMSTFPPMFSYSTGFSSTRDQRQTDFSSTSNILSTYDYPSPSSEPSTFPSSSPDNPSTRSSSSTRTTIPRVISALTLSQFTMSYGREKRSTLNCMDDINSCSNGRCNPATGQCDCNYGFILNAAVMQCDPDKEFLWCSSKGVISWNGTCACYEDYGKGGYPDSDFCVDGPACPFNCSQGICSFYGASIDDHLKQSCITDDRNALTIDGSGIAEDCPCQNGGYCLGLAPNTLPCTCQAGWVGEFCQTSTACENISCLNGGMCANGICACLPGWDGDRCEIFYDPCNNSCVNGVCQNFYQGYICKCDPGFNGTQCDQAINYCYYKNPCVSGTCVNAPNVADVVCKCDPGYTGPNCDQTINDVCSGKCEGDRCLPLLYPVYSCLCLRFDSKPINDNNPPNCDGTVKYCDLNPCFNGGKCVEFGPTQVGYNCSCLPGFNGTNCQVLNNDCSNMNCHHGDCLWSEVNGSYCECHQGYTGPSCNAPIPCNLNCKYGTCQLNNTVPFCNCTSFYTGPFCNLTTIPCDSSSCVHGTCQTENGGFYCKCSPGYKGDNCDERKDCTDMGWTCANGGTCSVEVTGTTVSQHCDCPLGVTGETCQNYGSRCSPNYCQNGGNCTELGLTVVCVCGSDFSGDHCEISKSKSFNLLWTSYPSTQEFVSPQRNTTLYREFTLCGWVQYAPPTAVNSTTLLPPFMGIITSNNPDVLNVDNQGVTINQNRILQVAITALQWHHVCIRSPSDSVDIKDKPIWNYFLDGVLVANATESPLPQNNFALYMVALAPFSSTTREKFQGEISEVQLYYTRLDDKDIAALAYQCSSTTLDPKPLVDWDNFTTLDRGNAGVMQLQPGVCDLSNCLPGRSSSNCNGLKDKIPPVVVSCPSDIGKVSNERTTHITWDPPTFQDNVGIDHVTNNFRPGEYFPWGYYQVIYVAYDAAGNTAVCQFAVIVAPNRCMAQDPEGGKVEATYVNGKNSPMMARVNCSDEFFPLEDPEFFVCDVLGQWNRVSSFSPDTPFAFPSCGQTANAVQNITGSLTANGTCQEVYNRLNSTLIGFCNSTDCVEIVPDCGDPSIFGPRKRSVFSDVLQHFDFTLITNDTREILITPIQQNLTSAFPYDESSASASYSCDPDYPQQSVDGQYASCAECAAGTFWKAETATCEDCPSDWYRGPQMEHCTPCPDGKITGGLSGASSPRLCYKNCTVGYYYNATLGDCSPAPFGYYQTNTGRTEYISCPLYTSTSRIGETNVEGCNRTCTMGTEFAPDRRDCVLCPYGTYKSTEMSACITCPEGRTTSIEGAKQISACDVLSCPPNTYIGNVSYPVNVSLSKNNICPPCPMGTWQKGQNATSCEPCSSLDDAPTCPLSSTCSPSSNTCGGNDSCERMENVTITKIPIYSCFSVTVNPINNGNNSKTVVIVAVTLSVVVLGVALAIVCWIFRDRIFCCKYIQKRDDALRRTTSDVYRVPRAIPRRALTTTTVSSNKSETEGNGLARMPNSPLPERPRMLPPPIITSRSALEAMRAPRTPQSPFTIPRIVSPGTSRSLPESDEEPVVRHFDDEEDDDDYFG